MSFGNNPFAGGGATSGGSGGSVPGATETVAGKIRKATAAEARAGTSDVGAMTPKKVADVVSAPPPEHPIVAATGTGLLSVAEPDLAAVSIVQTQNKSWVELGTVSLREGVQRDIGEVDTRATYKVVVTNSAHRQLPFRLKLETLSSTNAVLDTRWVFGGATTTENVGASGTQTRTTVESSDARLPDGTAKLKWSVWVDEAGVGGGNIPGQAYSISIVVSDIALYANPVTGISESGGKLTVEKGGVANEEITLPGGSGEENVQADWTQTDTNSDAYIRNKPNVYTKAESDARRTRGGSGLAGRLHGGNIFLDLQNPFTEADEAKLDGIETGATQDQTGAEIKSALEGLSGGDRLDASAVKNLPAGGSGSGVESIPFGKAELSQSLAQNSAWGDTAAGSTATHIFSFGTVTDDASLGLSDASGRLSFTNTHTDSDTLLESNGRVPLNHNGLGGRLKLYIREYSSTQPTTVNREVLVAEHPVVERSSPANLHFPLTAEVVGVRRGYTYRLEGAFEVEASENDDSANTTGSISTLYTLSDDKNFLSFRRVDENQLPAKEQLEGLEGDNRLSATAIKDLPTRASGGGTVEFSLGENLLPAAVVVGNTNWVSLGVKLVSGDIYQIIVDRDTQSTPPESLIVRITDAELQIAGVHGLAEGNIAFRNSGTFTEARLPISGTAFQVEGIYKLLGEVTGESRVPFPEVDAVPTLIKAGQRFYLTQRDGIYEPDFYESYTNPDPFRNRTETTGENNPANALQWGASIRSGFEHGTIKQHELVGSYEMQVQAPRFFNVALNVALMGSRTTAYLDFTSEEFSTATTKRFRFNRGTTSGNFTENGITYREWAIDTTEVDQSEDELIARLTELRDASGTNDLDIDVYSAATGDAPINYKPQFLLDRLIGQRHLKHAIEEEKRENRILTGEKILGDWNQLKRYESREAAIADGVLNLPGYQGVYGADRDQKGIEFTVHPGFPGTGGTRGGVSHRNRFSARMLQMGNGNGWYWTQAVRSRLEKFNNVEDASRINPNGDLVWISYYNGDAQTQPYIQIGLRGDFYSRSSIFLNTMRIVHANPGGTPTTVVPIGLDLVRQNTTGTFGGVEGVAYRGALSSALAQRLNMHEWDFQDDIVVTDFKESVNGDNVNINPDEVQFTSGSGFVAPSGAVLPYIGERDWVSIKADSQTVAEPDSYTAGLPLVFNRDFELAQALCIQAFFRGGACKESVVIVHDEFDPNSSNGAHSVDAASSGILRAICFDLTKSHDGDNFEFGAAVPLSRTHSDLTINQCYAYY